MSHQRKLTEQHGISLHFQLPEIPAKKMRSPAFGWVLVTLSAFMASFSGWALYR